MDKNINISAINISVMDKNIKISAPYIKKDGKDFFSYTDIWKNFTEQYNEGRPSREKLKDSHKRIYYTLIRLAKEQIDQRNKILYGSEFMAINSAAPLKVHTNRLELKNRSFGKDKTTRSISNYITRLTDAGVIVGNQFHGTQADFDLLINPDFLLIFDYYQQDYKPLSKYSSEKIETEKRAIRAAKLKIFQVLVSVGLRKPFNNSIITKGVSLTLNKSEHKPTKTITETSPKQKTAKPKIQKEKEKNCAKKEKEKDSGQKEKEIDPRIAHIMGLAAIFYEYLVAKIFPNHTINPAHKQKTIEYIAMEYFKLADKSHTKKFLETTWEKSYKKRIDLAAAWIERSKFDMKWQFPRHYLDVNNPKGFKKTGKWLTMAQNLTAKRNVEKVAANKKLTPDQKLSAMIRAFANNRTHQQLDYCRAYVKKVIPQYQNAFNQAAKQIVNA